MNIKLKSHPENHFSGISNILVHFIANEKEKVDLQFFEKLRRK